MAQETSPAFQFYVKEWRSSRKVARMSFAERGMYLEMLIEQWENCSVPDSPADLAELIGGTVEEWIDAWPALRRNFVAHEKKAGVIINLKLEGVRKDLHRYIKSSRKGGMIRSKSAKRSKYGTYLPNKPPAFTQPPHQRAGADIPARTSTPIASASASASASPTATATPIASASSAGAPTTHGTQHGRIFVHPWQTHALIDMLGPHAKGFALDEWIAGLSAAADAQGLVLEKRAVWPWVQQQLSEEIRRRGLPIAGAGPSEEQLVRQLREDVAQQNEQRRRRV